MWHEARKQERKIRGMLVDYRRRAERRQDFYEKIKADPTQFMQIHGRKCKIHLDPAVAQLGDGAAIIVPWQGQKDNLIDRFDVRAHLDYIPPIQKTTDLEEPTTEERQCNYERYRILAQNDFLCLSEDKYLHQLYLEEQFGINAQIENEQQRNTNKKPSNTGAAIGYTYEDSEPSAPFSHLLNTNPVNIPSASLDDEEESDSDIDMDVSIEINKLDNSQAHDLNTCGRNYGMMSNDFYSFLVKDADEADAIRMAREEEQEKIMLSGRKSRRERRAQRERRCAGRPLSPPSYAAKEEPVENQNDNESDSRSPSPENSGKITYITSFGGEDELQPHSKISININKPQKSFGNSTIGQRGIDGGMTYAEKVKANLDKLKQMNESSRSYRKKDSHSPKKPKQYLRSHSRSRSRSRYRRRRSRSYSRNRSRSRSRSRTGRGGRGYKDRRSRRRSSNSRSNSRTRSYNRRRNYSRSRTPHKTSQSHYRKSRSISSSSSSSVNRSRRERSKIISKKRSQSPLRNINRKSRSKSITKVPNLLFGTGTSIISNSTPKSVVLSDTIPTLQEQSSKVVTIKKTLTPPPQIPPVPIKRYYGRKRDNESSSSISSEGDTEEDVVTHMETNDTSNSNHFSPAPTTNLNPPAIAAIASGSGNNSNIYGSIGGTTIGSSTGNSSFLNNYSKSTVNPITSVSENKTLINMTSISSSSTANLRDRLKRKMQILLNKQYKADKKAEIERTERQIQQQQEREDEMRELALKLRRRQRELRHKYGTPTDSEDDDIPITSTNNSPNEKEMLMELKKRSKSISSERERTRGHHRSRSSSHGYSRRRYHRSRSQERKRSPYYNRSSRPSSSRNNRYRDRKYETRSRDRSRSRDYDRSDRYRNRNGNDYSHNMSKSQSKQLVDY